MHCLCTTLHNASIQIMSESGFRGLKDLQDFLNQINLKILQILIQTTK